MYKEITTSSARIASQFKAMASTVLLLVSVMGFNHAAYADVAHTVTCNDGTKVEVGGTDHFGKMACLKYGGSSTQHSKPGFAAKKTKLKSANKQTRKSASYYKRLAAKGKPKNAKQEALVKRYMKVAPSQRLGFKAKHPGTSKSIWDYGPYAVCFYASVAGGADVVEAGDECHEDWVD